jgi:hypothetical protein
VVAVRGPARRPIDVFSAARLLVQDRGSRSELTFTSRTNYQDWAGVDSLRHRRRRVDQPLFVVVTEAMPAAGLPGRPHAQSDRCTGLS